MPLTYNGKRENCHLLMSHCRYLDKSFYKTKKKKKKKKKKMFLELSSILNMNLVQTAGFDLLPLQQNIKFAKKKKKQKKKKKNTHTQKKRKKTKIFW